MDSFTFSIPCDVFSRLPIELQNQEIGNLFILVGGIRISQNRDETDEEFGTRTFEKGLKILSDESEYEIQFFENIIIPPLIEDFKDSSVDTQGRLMDKLSELTNGLSIKRKLGESDCQFRVRFYSRLLHKIPAGSEFEMVVFARQFSESDEEYESSEDEDEDEYEYDHESTSTRSGRRYSGGQKSYYGKGTWGRRYYLDLEGGSVLADELGGDTEPVEEGAWNDGSKKAGFNPKLKLKAKPNSGRASNSKPNPGRRSGPPISRVRL